MTWRVGRRGPLTPRPGETFDELLTAIGPGLADADRARLDNTYRYACAVHEGQRRRSGDAYITHPVAVAVLLARWHRPFESVLAGLLHDVLDGAPDLAVARRVAGDAPTNIVAAMSARPRSPSEVDLATAFQREVAIVHLADRLHNARTWQYVPPPAARVKAAETATLYAPVARKLGLTAAAAELRQRSLAELTGDAGRSTRLLSRALGVLPEPERARYALEWSADLQHLPPGRERLAFVAGLAWSALAIRAQSGR